MANNYIKKCFYKNCQNVSANSDVKFFHFNKHYLKQWVYACENKSLLNYSESTLLRKCFVCEEHFSNDSYRCVLPPFNNKLKTDAIPGSASTRSKQPEEGKLFRILNGVLRV